MSIYTGNEVKGDLGYNRNIFNETHLYIFFIFLISYSLDLKVMIESVKNIFIGETIVKRSNDRLIRALEIPIYSIMYILVYLGGLF